MADIPQVLATYDALVGVALGAGLTYGLGALNRRHQEAREDETRWYQARREAYATFLMAGSQSLKYVETKSVSEMPGNEFYAAMNMIRLVGSQPVIEATNNVLKAIREDARVYKQQIGALKQQVYALRERRQEEEVTSEIEDLNEKMNSLTLAPPATHFRSARAAFEEVARKDLGHP
jgi:gas vesicle protein